MPTLTRHRDLESGEESWLVCTISIRAGVPHDEDPWGWSCGFYPGCEPGEHTSGSAQTFDQARADFEQAWAVFIPIEPDGSRFSGVARWAGLDRAKIYHVGTRREVAVAEAELAHEMSLRRSLR
jgi:hypothetical protein